jgi:hypothetical protein
MYVIEDQHRYVQRLYATIGECWRCLLIRQHRYGTCRDLQCTLSRGEAVIYKGFTVRLGNGEEDINRYFLYLAEWKEILQKAGLLNEKKYVSAHERERRRVIKLLDSKTE